ncbi:sensor histidine kinase [Vaginisenegalia massiliensis]|uniref:sensor histidine kinase n=1 Tax=Vaginisenegalia massiliensis TaxID=2058294 RepID=UPI000F542BAA|nr:histidine kinase [Vaginisenegalia massiliensis]
MLTRYFKEWLLLVFLLDLWLFFYQPQAMSHLLWLNFAWLIFMAVWELLGNARLKLGLSLVMAVGIYLAKWPLFCLIPLLYMTSRSLGNLSYGLALFTLVTSLSQPWHALAWLATSYLSLTTVKLEQLKKDQLQTDDQLAQLKLQTRQQKESLLMAQQQDIDIAILSERNRIAGQLHDAVGHSLSRSILQLESMKLLPQAQEMIPFLDQLQINLRQGMDQIRQTIHQMHHESLDLATQIKEIEASYPNFTIHFDQHIQSTLTYSFKKDLLMIMKEAIINSIKHSDANRIVIVLSEYPQHIKLLIRDNSHPHTDPKPTSSSGLGHEMMQEIAKKYHGVFLNGYQDGYYLQFNLYPPFLNQTKEEAR